MVTLLFPTMAENGTSHSISDDWLTRALSDYSRPALGPQGTQGRGERGARPHGEGSRPDGRAELETDRQRTGRRYKAVTDQLQALIDLL